MQTFIDKFRQTSFYRSILARKNVVAIYLLGSRSCGVVDDRSDYDIVVLTLDGDHVDDASRYEYLKYKGKKVHWYYTPIKQLFELDYKTLTLDIMGPIQLKNICDDLIIYENPKYKDILNYLYENKNKLSTLASHILFSLECGYIDEILCSGEVAEKHYSKWLYHLCLVSYYLAQEQPDIEFLKTIKRIRYQPVSSEYKQLIIERLRVYKNYIEQNPIDADYELKQMCEQLKLFIE